MNKLKFLFLCTDNFTRSVTAEMCLLDYLLKNNITNIQVWSIGTNASSDTSDFHDTHFDYMNKLWIDTSKFSRTQLNEKIFSEADLIIWMAEEHQNYVLEHYKKKIKIYSEIINWKKTSIIIPEPDVEWVNKQLTDMVDYIYNTMPDFVDWINKLYE